jgi:hypothetical protein
MRSSAVLGLRCAAVSGCGHRCSFARRAETRALPHGKTFQDQKIKFGAATRGIIIPCNQASRVWRTHAARHPGILKARITHYGRHLTAAGLWRIFGSHCSVATLRGESGAARHCKTAVLWLRRHGSNGAWAKRARPRDRLYSEARGWLCCVCLRLAAGWHE